MEITINNSLTQWVRLVNPPNPEYQSLTHWIPWKKQKYVHNLVLSNTKQLDNADIKYDKFATEDALALQSSVHFPQQKYQTRKYNLH